MDNVDKFGLAGVAALLLAIVGLVIGWVVNIVKLFGLAGGGFDGNGLEIGFRAIGVLFAPIGGILGWF